MLRYPRQNIIHTQQINSNMYIFNIFLILTLVSPPWMWDNVIRRSYSLFNKSVTLIILKESKYRNLATPYLLLL